MELLNTLKGLGTAVNVCAVIAGGLIGTLFGKKIKESIQDSLMKVLGLSVMFVGLSGALSKMLIIEDGRLSSYGTLMMIISLSLGTLIGELINIEKYLEKFGDKLKEKFKAKNDGGFTDAFVNSSLVVCVGAMAVVGSLQDGLTGDHATLFAKSLLDFLIIIVMASSMGIGCLFSFIPIGIFQGSITLLAELIKPYVTTSLVDDISLVGSVMIFAVGVNSVFNKKFRVGNMLPALLVTAVYSIVSNL